VKTIYAMGYEIQSKAQILMSDPPPTISLRRMGGEASTYFTPDEVRRFAEALLAAAKAAEEKPQ
jgi:hypothetical protein